MVGLGACAVLRSVIRRCASIRSAAKSRRCEVVRGVIERRAGAARGAPCTRRRLPSGWLLTAGRRARTRWCGGAGPERWVGFSCSLSIFDRELEAPSGARAWTEAIATLAGDQLLVLIFYEQSRDTFKYLLLTLTKYQLKKSPSAPRPFRPPSAPSSPAPP